MNHRTVLFTANAGFFLSAHSITLAVDAFPRTADRGFSALSEEHFSRLCQRSDLQDVRYVIATHKHNDHYCREWNEAFLHSHPRACFFGAMDEECGPRIPSSQAGSSQMSTPILLQGDRPTYYLPGITLEFLRLPHEGSQFADVANYGCLVTISGSFGSAQTATPSGPCRILFLGDAKPADPAIAEWIGNRRIDLAMLNFPWIALPKGRQFIQKYLPYAKIGVIHLPYEKEDRNHYVAAARKALAQLDCPAITLFTAYGQEMNF